MDKITLKAARVNANMSRKEVAEKLGVSVWKIKMAELYPYKTDTELMLALCEMYKWDISSIFLQNTSTLAGKSAN